MIITLIAVALVIISIVCVIIDCNTKNGVSSLIYTPLFLVGITALIVSLVIICKVQINRDIDYQNKLYEKTTLEYRIENEDAHTTGNELLYRDIVKFNNSLRMTKKWANNTWVSWFFNGDIATIDYIEIG